MRALQGKIVILTGASRGIGVPLAVALGRRGARVVLTARDRAGLEATAEQVRAVGAEAHVIPCDVASEPDRARLLDEVARLGPIEGVLHNAGIEYTLAFADQSPSEIGKQIAVNLDAPLQLSRMVLPGMVQRKSGFLIYMSSMSGKSPTPYNAVYTATKHGLVGFAASLRIELEGTGVHVGVVCPSFVDEAGMFADQGVAAPAMMRAVPLQQVVHQTMRAIDGSFEELVTPTPVRPLLALSQMFPGLVGPVLKGMGVLPVLADRARALGAKRRADQTDAGSSAGVRPEDRHG
jgi:short-subunit dehydrogenase